VESISAQHPDNRVGGLGNHPVANTEQEGCQVNTHTITIMAKSIQSDGELVLNRQLLGSVRIVAKDKVVLDAFKQLVKSCRCDAQVVLKYLGTIAFQDPKSKDMISVVLWMSCRSLRYRSE
jgi:hypothetical protein